MSKIFEGWRHPDAIQDEKEKYVEFNNGHKAPIFKVNSIHALNTLVGYCKHIYQGEGNIYFRGQTAKYGTMKPSLYRGLVSNKTLGRRQHKLNTLINETYSTMPLLNKMDQKLIAPLFQHYGIHTDWLDLVDNLWVALWFSIHEYVRPESNKRYEFVKRISKVESPTYLYLMLSDAVERHNKIPGYYKGENYEVVDLRVSAPSVFLRPHNQHAILLRKRNVISPEMAEMADSVKLIIELDPKAIIEWLGIGRLLTVENIYPSPVYDQGYSILLKDCRANPNNGIGCITSITHEAFI